MKALVLLACPVVIDHTGVIKGNQNFIAQNLVNLPIRNVGRMNHTPHECRHTFETQLDSAGANRKCIDLLMGHVSKDTGNRVYNHKTLDELKAAVEMINIF